MKNIQKSIRMTEAVYDYISKFDGKNFNDKFNNAVLFFMSSDKDLRKKIKSLSVEITSLENSILDRRQILKNLDTISSYVNFACDHCDNVLQKR